MTQVLSVFRQGRNPLKLTGDIYLNVWDINVGGMISNFSDGIKIVRIIDSVGGSFGLQDDIDVLVKWVEI